MALSSTNLLSRATTSHTTFDQSLSSFAPELLKHVLANSQNKIKAPFVKTFEGVGFFADVSGFTKATESLSNAMGDLGTEILAHKINAYLPHIAKKIVASGGDVVKFAGDALLCIWPPPPDTLYNPYEVQFKRLEKKWRRFQNRTAAKKSANSKINDKINELNEKFEDVRKKYMKTKFQNETQQKEAVKKNINAAIQCAMEIQQQFGSMDLSGAYYDAANNNKSKKKKKGKKSEKIEFRVKLGIGIGKIHLLIVGGNLGRCEYLICGDGLIQAFDCENDCDPELERMIIVSEKVSKIESVQNNFVLKKVVHPPSKNGKKHKDLNNYQVVEVNKKSKKRTKIERKHYGHLIPDIQNQLASKLSAYIPAAVKPHLEMPQQIWTGELREVTIMFVSLPWNARSFAKFTNNILEQLQTIIYTLQDVIYKYQGSLNKFLIDDKGSTVMAVFGLPPVAHENDPVRAVLAALELREKIRNKKQPAAIGISTGTVFVGLIGSKGSRREYGILGDKVNLSARLMGISKKNPVKIGEVVVDSSVYIRSRKEVRIEWTDLGQLTVKGKADKVHIYRPARNNIPISAHKIGHAVYLETSDKVSLKAITEEIDTFLSREKEIESKQKNGRVILVEGEIGIGKTALLGQIQVRNSKSMWFLWGKANEFHECYNVDYIVWRQILLGYTTRYSLMIQKNRYLFANYVRARRPDLVPWLFLINDLIELGNYKLLEDEFLGCEYSMENAKKRGTVKSYELDKYRHDIVFTLLEWTARVKPIAIIIDELQYLTKKDWQITRRLCKLVKQGILKNVMVFLGSTPIDNQRYRPLFKSQKLIDKFSEIRNTLTHKVVSPAPWGLNKTKFFIRKYFDIGDCSERVIKSVHSQCGGRPGFCEHFLCELTTEENQGQFIHVFHRQHLSVKNDKKAARMSSYGVFGGRNGATLHNSNRNEMYGCFAPELDNRFKIGLDVSFPIPSYIMQITLSHVDKLNYEQAFILKIASVICKSKGNNSCQFDEHMIRGCHPLSETGMNEMNRLRLTLDRLCDMKFIYKLSDHSSRIRHSINDYVGTDLGEASKRASMMRELHKVPSYNNFDAMFDEKKKKEKSQGQGDGNTHVDDTEFDGITDPMPATKALLQEPSKYVPYKKGKMYKRGVNFINMTESERIFVFKHRTLYWIKTEDEEYPRSRIKFDQSVQKLKREDQKSLSIKTPRKEYILRCNKKRDMEEWFKLFTQALRANFLNDAMIKRMQQHQTVKQATTPQPSSAPIRPFPRKSASEKNLNTNPNKKHQQRQSPAPLDMNALLKGKTAFLDDSGNKKPKNGSHAKPNMNDLLNGAKTEKKKGVRFDVEEEPSESLGIDPEDLETDVVAVLRQQFSNPHIHMDLEDILDGSDEDKMQRKKSSSSSSKEKENKLIDSKISSQLKLQINVDSGLGDVGSVGGLSYSQSLTVDEDDEIIGPQDGDSCYEFAYGFLRDIVYEQMLYNQRKQLHTNSLKYIARCLKQKNDDKLALLHTRHIECVQRYGDMLQGEDQSKSAFQPKRASFFGRRALR